MGILDTKEKKEPLGNKALRDHWVLQEFKAQVEYKDLKDRKELRVKRAKKASGILDTKEKKEPLGYLAHKVLWVQQELKVRQEDKDLKDRGE